MASESRRPDPALNDILFREPFRFDFFQAVRLLELIYPEKLPVGGQARPAEEAVRFHSHVSLSFPPSALQDLSAAGEDMGPAQMTAAFIGLTGPLGVLPRHYTELMLERMRRHDNTLRDFFDLFNHRIISLFYRAWEKYRFNVAYERLARTAARSPNSVRHSFSRVSAANQQSNRQRPDETHYDPRGSEGYDTFSLHLFDLIGMGTRGLRGRLEFGDEALLFYAGLLGQHPRSASALGNLLQDYFSVPVAVVQFVGQWLDITAENRTRLGEANSALGSSAVAGIRIWDQQAGFKLRVGPLSYDEFERLLPGGDMHRAMIQMTRYAAGQEFDFDVQLILQAPEVPWCRLGDHRARLGFSSWLKVVELKQNDDQVIFSGGLTRLGALPG